MYKKKSQNELMELDRKDGITLILKPTNQCNLDCQYCYDKPARQNKKACQMSIEIAKKAIDMASEYAKRVKILWHGGEPLLMSQDFYREVNDYLLDNYNTTYTQQMQTNGYMIQKDETWIDVFKECEIQAGTSYDGAFQYMRTDTSEDDYMLRTMELMVKNELSSYGGITVIHKNNIHELIQMYEFLKKQFKGNYGLTYHLGFGTKEVETDIFNIDKDTVFNCFSEFYKYMLEDGENGHLIDNEFIRTVDLLLTNTANRGCENIDCRKNWLTVLSDGTLLHCSRFSIYNDFGNINDYDSIDEIFAGKKYSDYHNLVEERLQKDCHNCSVKEICQGGCNAKFIRTSNTVETECNYIKMLLLATYFALLQSDIVNVKFMNHINKRQLFTPKVVKEILKIKRNYTEEIDFRNIDTLMSSKIYKITKRLNELKMCNTYEHIPDMLDVENVVKTCDNLVEMVLYEEFR